MHRSIAALLWLVFSPLHAQTLEPTPSDMPGPYYPDVLPGDQDNDLVQIAGQPESAKGQKLLLSGRVLETTGKPIAGARIEIWQTDANGRYLHRRDPSPQARDPYFQGFGATLSAADGTYRFRTVAPIAYETRPAHIHARVLRDGQVVLVTQLYFPGRVGEPGLPARAEALRASRQTLRFGPAPGQNAPRVEQNALSAEQNAVFDFVLPARR